MSPEERLAIKREALEEYAVACETYSTGFYETGKDVARDVRDWADNLDV